MKELPNWFKEKYELELSKEDKGDYWIKFEDVLKLWEEEK
jgi:hypothetical protein